MNGSRRRPPWALLGASLAALWCAAAVHAQAPSTPSPPAARRPPECPPPPTPLTPERLQRGLESARDRGFLWRITKDGRSSHLYGTLHAGEPSWMFPGPTIQQAVQASDTVALELDVLDPQVQQGLTIAVARSDPAPLPPDLQARLTAQLVAACLDPAPYARMAPEIQIAALTVGMARRQGLDPAYAIDLALAVVGRRWGKPVVSLETPAGQMAALRLPKPELTREFVARALDDMTDARAVALVARLATAWRDGDFADLEAYDSWCQCRTTESERLMMTRLLDDRNDGLAERIAALHASGRSVFAAVGSLHMVGPTGLPALLAARGYTVERVGFAR